MTKSLIYFLYLLGFIVRCQSDNDVERVVYLDSDVTEFTFAFLKCGTKYTFTVQSVNSVGRSLVSNAVRASTEGEAPLIAEEAHLMYVNSTSVTLYLDAWPETRCPVLHFTIAYKMDENWIPYGGGYLIPEPIVISDLMPSTIYTIRVIAHNTAGMTAHDYIFATRTLDGEAVPIEFIGQANEKSKSITDRINLIIPISSAVICLVSIFICVLILIRRRKVYGQYVKSKHALDSSRMELDNQQNYGQQRQQHIYSSPNLPRKDSFNTIQKGSNFSGTDYDVYPYATFTVPPNQMQTFSEYGVSNSSPNKEKTQSIHKRRRAKTPVDNSGVEISCISNQPTLPIGRKCATPTTLTTNFSTHQDTNTVSSMRRKKPYIRNTTDYENDSSSESADVSPEIARRLRSRRNSNVRDGNKMSSKQSHKNFKTTEDDDALEITENSAEHSTPKRLQHEKLNEELSSIVNEYRKRRTKRDDHMIHV